VLTLRAGRDEVGVLVAAWDGGLFPVLGSVGLLGFAVDFEGSDFPDANVDLDMGLLYPGTDLLVTDGGLLRPCTALLGPLVVLLVGVLLARVEVGGLLGPGTVDAEPEPEGDADEDDALPDTVFSTLSSFTGTSIVA
jgi:hypothetical protein